MKRISTIIMALVMLMTMAQCKKDNPTTPDNQNNVVTIILDVKGNNGSRVDVNTTTGTVDFEIGDMVYVGSGGKYVGFLTHNGTNFVGNITNPTENQPLQFYFLGNVTPTETLSAGTTEECSVIISDQTEHLPVISCAASFENYVSGVTSYTGHLLNKCTLVKFNVTTPSNSAICIIGMNNKVTVDFTQNTVTHSIDGDGVIMLSAGSGENVEKWAILLPQEALEEGEEGSAYSEDGIYTGTRPAISIIADNGYFPQGISFEVSNATVSDIPIGAINGLFTINANGNQVYFSKGNLQYIGSANNPYWKFAEHQWEYLGTTTGQNSEFQNVDRDLFGWGTSGYIHEHSAFCYQPWSTSTIAEYYRPVGLPNNSVYILSGQADWGYNAISNGGNLENQWRTLSMYEWQYLMQDRNTPSGIRYAKVTVNGVYGLILLPDDWDASSFTLIDTNDTYGSSFTSNIIPVGDWESIFEANGAVFLPASGYRNGISIFEVGYIGYYWLPNYINTSIVPNSSYCLYFRDGSTGGYDVTNPFYGYSVRLVQEYNP